jgi:Uma2 family endonuclease
MGTTTHLTTADQLIRLSDDGNRYELVKGELLTMSPTGGKHGVVAMRLSRVLANYIEDSDLGLTFAAETGFRLEQDPDTVLAPDFAFVSKDRISTLPDDGYVRVAPDLVVEVISPSQSDKEMRLKAELWISLGVKRVWLVQPKKRTVELFEKTDEHVLLRENDELTGGELLPGFRVRVSEIFSY